MSTRISPHTFYNRPWPQVGSNAPERPAKPSQPVRFSGMGDMLSSFIGLIDRNRAAELISSDGLGMLVPRTGVAAAYRGVDDARETLIREGAGLVCVAMLAGLTNQFMVHILGNRVGLYNPHGTPGKAWINAKNLRIFSELYNHSLNSVGSLPEARQIFIQRILEGLESGDRTLSIEGRLSALKTILTQPNGKQEVERALGHMAQSLPNQGTSLKSPGQLASQLQAGQTIELRNAFLEAGWGKLSKQGKAELTNWFSNATLTNTPQGNKSIDQLAWKQTTSAPSSEQAFLKQRLKLSLDRIRTNDPALVKAADEKALNHGLTSMVNLKRGNQELLTAQSRKTLLKELKAFLEHYVDRAAFQVSHPAKTNAGLTWGQQKHLIRRALFASESKGLRALFPVASDGLVTATLKAKTAYTWVPILTAIAANGVTTFLNNYITQKKYGGKVFFPGEEAFIPIPQNGTAQHLVQNGRLA